MTGGGRARPQRHTPGDPGWPSSDIHRLAAAACAEGQTNPEDGDSGPYFCRKCTSVFSVDRSELEPSPFCNLCAHDAAAQLGAEILIIKGALDQMPPAVAAGIRAQIEAHRQQQHAAAFVEGVLGLTEEKVLGRYSHGVRRRK